MENYDQFINPNDNYFNNILPNIMGNLIDGKFIDKNFPPNNEKTFANKINPLVDYTKGYFESIYNQEYNEAIENYRKGIRNNTLVWKRISDIIDVEKDQSRKIFINQNFLGDCYFIAFLRSLQKFQPNIYFNLFGLCFPEIGYYEIYFFTKDGKQFKVFVDDYILVKNDNKDLRA